MCTFVRLFYVSVCSLCSIYRNFCFSDCMYVHMSASRVCPYHVLFWSKLYFYTFVCRPVHMSASYLTVSSLSAYLSLEHLFLLLYLSLAVQRVSGCLTILSGQGAYLGVVVSRYSSWYNITRIKSTYAHHTFQAFLSLVYRCRGVHVGF